MIMRKVIGVLFCLLCINSQLFAQESKKSVHRTISVDGTYLLSFFKTEEARMTPLNFKYRFNRYSLRSGFNLNYDSGNNHGLDADIKIGIEFPNKLSEKWQYYYGADLVGSFTTYNSSETTISRFVAVSFLGFEVFFSSQFSLGYEPSLLASFYTVRNPNSFNEPIIYDNSIRLTGLSQFFINFYF